MIIKLFFHQIVQKTRKNKEIKFIILHYTGMQSEIVSLKDFGIQIQSELSLFNK